MEINFQKAGSNRQGSKLFAHLLVNVQEDADNDVLIWTGGKVFQAGDNVLIRFASTKADRQSLRFYPANYSHSDNIQPSFLLLDAEDEFEYNIPAVYEHPNFKIFRDIRGLTSRCFETIKLHENAKIPYVLQDIQILFTMLYENDYIDEKLFSQITTLNAVLALAQNAGSRSESDNAFQKFYIKAFSLMKKLQEATYV